MELELERLLFIHQIMCQYYEHAIKNKHRFQVMSVSEKDKEEIMKRINDEPAILGRFIYESMLNANKDAE